MKQLFLLACLLLFNMLDSAAQALPDYSVNLRFGLILPDENIHRFVPEATLHRTEVLNGHYYRLIQFYRTPDAARREAIGRLGIELLEYLPQYAYIASIPTATDPQDLAALGIRSILPIPVEWKMNTSRPAPWAIQKGWAELMVLYYADLDHQEVLDYCKADGIEVLAENGINNALRIRIREDRLTELASLPYISFVEWVSPPDTPDDFNGRALHKANAIDTDFPSGRQYNGQDVPVLVRDDGFVGPHIDIYGRNTQLAAFDDPFGHAEGVAGIFVGAGNLDPVQKGMAAGAYLYVIDYESDFLDNTLPLHLDEGVLVTNSSYSNGCNAGYTVIAVTIDQQLYQNPTLMHVFSAGNSNGQDCGYGAGNQWGNITGGHKQGKNAIATANLNRDGSLVTSSSRGPAHDGRIKPDISANGQNQVSLEADNAYGAFGGTSGAAPGIAGIMAQLHQAYRELNGGVTAEAALLKAALLNTATDRGNIGPDFKFGWGQVNALRAVQLLEENRYFDAQIDQDLSNTHTISIPDGLVQARIMVYWPDPEASPMAVTALVNNLDATLAGPGATVYQPYLLDPSPNATTLDLAAANGVDNLNNMEQIALIDPEAGDYTLTVQGTNIPFGPQKYFVLMEYLFADSITVIYPFGGEGFNPGETESLHWDAYGDFGDFTIDFSIDNGASWTGIDTVDGDQRLLDWVVPDTLSGQALIRVSRNGFSATNLIPFSIIGVPQNLGVGQVCPEFFRLEWDSVPGATGYDVFVLGEQYMDSIGTTADLFFDVPTINDNPTIQRWMSVRALGLDEARGRRAIAVPFSGGLNECLIGKDAALLALSPDLSTVNACGPSELPLTLTVFNGGLSDLTDIQVSYQIDSDAPVSEIIPGPLASNTSLDYTFTQLPAIIQSDTFDLTVWVTVADDEAFFNDTLSSNLTISYYPDQGVQPGWTEGFEADLAPPLYWQIQNPDEDYTWELKDVVAGSDGQPSQVIFMDNYFYSDVDQEDYLITLPLAIPADADDVFLTFDISYAPYNLTQYFETFRVEVLTDCGATFADTIYDKTGAELATTEATTQVFSPTSASQWRTEVLPMAAYAGQSVVIRFVNYNRYGNSLHLDNINLVNLSPPTAGFMVDLLGACTGESRVFTNTSTGPNLEYQWFFGPGADPATANGAGPYTVTFNTPGTQTITLIAGNGVGLDTFELDMAILPQPVPSFEADIAGTTVTFTNTTQNANLYSWDFGDGNTSSEVNPVHTYQDADNYTVTLQAWDPCGPLEVSQTIVISGVWEAGNQGPSMTVFPNPGPGLYEIRWENWPLEPVQLDVFDFSGRLVYSTWTLPFQAHQMDLRGLPAGIYALKAGQEAVVRLVKQ